MAGFREPANLARPHGIVLTGDPCPVLGQAHLDDLSVDQGHVMLGEALGCPLVFGMLVVGEAGDPMSDPHPLEERRAVALAVEHDDEAAEERIGFQIILGRLASSSLGTTSASRVASRPSLICFSTTKKGLPSMSLIQ